MASIAGKYEVIRELGEGASGKVLLVKHADIGVHYALKLLNTALSDKRFIERFKREAEVLTRFSHPGSIQLRDFGRTEHNVYYMAMDYCEGVTLDRIIDEKGEMPVRQVLNILDQLLEVLAAAHKAGIVHRDIKPENIMLIKDSEGKEFVKVLDFGIAKLREVENSSMTQEGSTIGTPQYMSPEQASGERKLDQRVDVYATGVLAYEMLTGSPPFIGETVLQTLIMHLTQNPKGFANEFRYPIALESLVMKALEKNRDARYQTAQEFREAVHKVQGMLTRTTAEGASTDSQKVIAEHTAKKAAKILCLDDSEMILHIFKHILEESGYEVYTANNSAGVHSYLFDKGVELLVTDVQMPDLPGTKVCRMLKQSLPKLKVLLFSNLSDNELERLAAESKADGWISKNTKPKEWLEKIVNTIESGQSSKS